MRFEENHFSKHSRCYYAPKILFYFFLFPPLVFMDFAKLCSCPGGHSLHCRFFYQHLRGKWKKPRVFSTVGPRFALNFQFLQTKEKYFFPSISGELWDYRGVFAHDQTMKFEGVLNILGLQIAFLGMLPWQRQGIFFRFIRQERKVYFNVTPGSVSYFSLSTTEENN